MTTELDERGRAEAMAARQMAACKLYEAEIAVHDAHQTHVDAWIRAANDRLHDAVVLFCAAAAKASATTAA